MPDTKKQTWTFDVDAKRVRPLYLYRDGEVHFAFFSAWMNDYGMVKYFGNPALCGEEVNLCWRMGRDMMIEMGLLEG